MIKERIIDYLTVQLIKDTTFKSHYAQRVRAAWILAKKKYSTLTDKEKNEILAKINLDQSE